MYRDLTFFTEAEVLHAFQRFYALAPDFVTKRAMLNDKDAARLSIEALQQLEEIRNNPFRDRILKCFSVEDNGSMAFDEFLEMASVYSADAPFNLKVEYAFRIYDTSDSDTLDRDDLKNTLLAQIGKNNPIPDGDIDILLDNVIHECDLDGDEKICFTEFEAVMEKSPAFQTAFSFHLK